MKKMTDKIYKNWSRIIFIWLGAIALYEGIIMNDLSAVIRVALSIAGLSAIGFGIMFSGETLTDEYSQKRGENDGR